VTLNKMVASIPQIESALNLFLNAFIPMKLNSRFCFLSLRCIQILLHLYEGS